MNLRWVAITLPLAAPVSAHAFDDKQFCAAVQQVVRAYSDLRTSLAAYAAAVTLREAAQTSYDAAFDAYLHGVGTYTDVANEQRRRFNSR